VVEDATCGTVDATHDASLTFDRDRLSLQVELAGLLTRLRGTNSQMRHFTIVLPL